MGIFFLFSIIIIIIIRADRCVALAKAAERRSGCLTRMPESEREREVGGGAGGRTDGRTERDVTSDAGARLGETSARVVPCAGAGRPLLRARAAAPGPRRHAGIPPAHVPARPRARPLARPRTDEGPGILALLLLLRILRSIEWTHGKGWSGGRAASKTTRWFAVIPHSNRLLLPRLTHFALNALHRGRRSAPSRMGARNVPVLMLMLMPIILSFSFSFSFSLSSHSHSHSHSHYLIMLMLMLI